MSKCKIKKLYSKYHIQGDIPRKKTDTIDILTKDNYKNDIVIFMPSLSGEVGDKIKLGKIITKKLANSDLLKNESKEKKEKTNQKFNKELFEYFYSLSKKKMYPFKASGKSNCSLIMQYIKDVNDTLSSVQNFQGIEIQDRKSKDDIDMFYEKVNIIRLFHFYKK